MPISYSVIQEARTTSVPNAWTLGFTSVKQAQVIIQNTDNIAGTFVVNFLFSEGTRTATDSVTQTITPGEMKMIASNLPFDGDVTVRTTIVPGNKQVTESRTVTKQVPLLNFYFMSK